MAIDSYWKFGLMVIGCILQTAGSFELMTDGTQEGLLRGSFDSEGADQGEYIEVEIK